MTGLGVAITVGPPFEPPVHTLAANLSDGVVRDMDQARRYGQLIQHEAWRLSDMTEQVLGFAHVESARSSSMQLHSVATIVQRAVQGMRSQLEAGGFVCDSCVPPDLPLVLIDAAAVERALRNLIGNAFKYSTDRREIRINAGTESRQSRNAVWIAVDDLGIGIEPDELTSIFEPFRRGRAAIEGSFPGTGLGLSLVRRIAQLHHGRVCVRSEPGVGSTFTLYLPCQ